MSRLKYKSTSPLARLVLFMICLSIAGSLVAWIHYNVIDRPAQIAALQAPENSDQDQCWVCKDDLKSCKNDCLAPYNWFEKFFYWESKCYDACVPAGCEQCLWEGAQ